MTIMTRTEFRKTKAPWPKEAFESQVVAAYDGTLPESLTAEDCHHFGTEDDSYCIHEYDGQFWVHAWWYNPAPYASMNVAMSKLYEWYLEWAE